jgi:hypothetical protein
MAIVGRHEAKKFTEIWKQIELFDDEKRFGSRVEPR